MCLPDIEKKDIINVNVLHLAYSGSVISSKKGDYRNKCWLAVTRIESDKRGLI